MATLKQTIEDDLGEVFFDTDEFAEDATYLPVGGGTPRTVIVCVQNDSEWTEGEQTNAEEEEPEILISKDESAPEGGVANPQIGDKIKLTRKGTERIYKWLGEKVSDDLHSWVLRFRRRDVYQRGTSQTRAT